MSPSGCFCSVLFTIWPLGHMATFRQAIVVVLCLTYTAPLSLRWAKNPCFLGCQEILFPSWRCFICGFIAAQYTQLTDVPPQCVISSGKLLTFPQLKTPDVKQWEIVRYSAKNKFEHQNDLFCHIYNTIISSCTIYSHYLSSDLCNRKSILVTKRFPILFLIALKIVLFQDVTFTVFIIHA